MSNIIIAGQAAEGSGALVGWSGQGALSRADILAALAAADCPASWAPAAKSCKAHAGQAVRRLDAIGYIVRAARRSDTDRAIERATGRTWEARWIVSRSHASSAEVGDAAGEVELTVELADGELTCKGDSHLSAQVRSIFEALRDAESYQAGDVTTWLARVLINELGATRFGVGYYVPAGSRARANALVTSMSIRWGRAWICPALPVATSDELKMGIVRGLEDDVRAVQAVLVRERSMAREAKKGDMSPATAARLLRSVGEMSERVGAYRALCGDALVRPVVALLRSLTDDLGAIADATSIRGSLIEMDGPTEPAAPEPPSPAQIAADRALAERVLEVERQRRIQDIDTAVGIMRTIDEASARHVARAAAEATLEDAVAESRRPEGTVRDFRRPRTSALPSNAAIADRRRAQDSDLGDAIAETYRVPPPKSEPEAELAPSETSWLLELD